MSDPRNTSPANDSPEPTIPNEVLLAVNTLRPELMRLAPRRPMDTHEIEGLYEVIALLIKESAEYCRHNAKLNAQVSDLKVASAEIRKALESTLICFRAFDEHAT